MAKLYEIADGYRNIQALLDNPEIPMEIVVDGLTKLDDDFEEKAENIAKVLREMEGDITTLKDEEVRISSRRKALENRKQGLKLYLESYMRAISKTSFKGKLFTLSISKNKPSVEISNLEGIPSEYIEVEEVKKVDKRKLLEALQNGEEIQGAAIKQNESLRIR